MVCSLLRLKSLKIRLFPLCEGIFEKLQTFLELLQNVKPIDIHKKFIF